MGASGLGENDFQDVGSVLGGAMVRRAMVRRGVLKQNMDISALKIPRAQKSELQKLSRSPGTTWTGNPKWYELELVWTRTGVFFFLLFLPIIINLLVLLLKLTLFLHVFAFILLLLWFSLIIIFKSNISTVSCIQICNCHMHGSSMNTPIMIMASSWSIIPVDSSPPINHAAAADMDATNGAYVAAGRENTNNKSNNNANNINIRLTLTRIRVIKTIIIIRCGEPERFSERCSVYYCLRIFSRKLVPLDVWRWWHEFFTQWIPRSNMFSLVSYVYRHDDYLGLCVPMGPPAVFTEWWAFPVFWLDFYIEAVAAVLSETPSGLDSALLVRSGLDSRLLGPPVLDSELLERSGLDSVLLGPSGLDSALLERSELGSSRQCGGSSRLWILFEELVPAAA